MITSLALCSVLQAQNPAITPVDRLNEAWWKDRHEAKVKLTQQGDVDVIFLGDSITQGWEGAGKAVWDKHFAPLKAANFGFSGDRTEHVLWRLANGEMVGLHPKAVVLMIGTNNIGHGSSTPEQTAIGVSAVVHKLQESFPNAKIMLLGIFPRGTNADDPYRQKVAQATQLFQPLDQEKNVYFKDIGYAFVRGSGQLRTLLMPDSLHLNEAGYGIWAQAIEDDLRKLIAE